MREISSRSLISPSRCVPDDSISSQPPRHAGVAGLQVQQPRHAQDAVQRSAQLVADVADELGLHRALAQRQLQRLVLGHGQRLGMQPQHQAVDQPPFRCHGRGQQQAQQQHQAGAADRAELVAAQQQAQRCHRQHRQHIGGGGALAELQPEGGDAGHAGQDGAHQRGQRNRRGHQQQAGDAPDDAVGQQQGIGQAAPVRAARTAQAVIAQADADARRSHAQLGQQPAVHQPWRHRVVAQLQRHEHRKGRGHQRAQPRVAEHHVQLLVADLRAQRRIELLAGLAGRVGTRPRRRRVAQRGRRRTAGCVHGSVSMASKPEGSSMRRLSQAERNSAMRSPGARPGESPPSSCTNCVMASCR